MTITKSQSSLSQNNISQKLIKEGHHDKFSFDQLLSKIGIGKYQIIFYLIMGTLGLTEGSQVSVFTMMIPVLKQEWGVSDEANSLQTSLVFLGYLTGSMASGQFSDRLGRKRPFLYSSFFTCVLSLLSALSQNLAQLIFFRTLIGILVGFFAPLGVTMLTEVTPPEVRGIYLGLITVTFNIGQLFGLLVGSFTIPTLESGNWRLLIVICGLPGLLAWCLSYWMLDDTVRFTLLDQQFDLSFQIIDKMILMNRPAQIQALTDEDKKHLKQWVKGVNECQKSQQNGSISSLFSKSYKLLTPIIWLNWFTLSFMYYGIIIILPYVFDKLGQQDEEYGHNLFQKLGISASSEIFAAFVVAMLIEKKGFGRKNSMIIIYIVQGVLSIIVFYDDRSRFVFWSTLAKFFMCMTFIFTYQFTADVYSTKIRTTGIGMANGVGRLGGVLMPWVLMNLMEQELLLPFLLFGAISFLTSAIDLLFLQFDTTDRELDQDQEDEL